MTTEWDKTTLSGKPADLEYYHEHGGAPQPIDERTGQHKDYWVLPAEERAKGFVRPVRNSYRHVGRPAPKFPLLDLTDEQKERYSDCGYVKYEAYPEEMRPSLGRYWTQQDLDKIGKGCGTTTTMGPAIAETYARNPHYYGATMCVNCCRHLPVGEQGEFVWPDGSRVGT